MLGTVDDVGVPLHLLAPPRREHRGEPPLYSVTMYLHRGDTASRRFVLWEASLSGDGCGRVLFKTWRATRLVPPPSAGDRLDFDAASRGLVHGETATARSLRTRRGRKIPDCSSWLLLLRNAAANPIKRKLFGAWGAYCVLPKALVVATGLGQALDLGV